MKTQYDKESISNKKILEKLNLNSFLYDALVKAFKIDEEKSGLISISKPLLFASIDSSSQLVDYFLNITLKEGNYVRINDQGENLKINKIPSSLVKKLMFLLKKNIPKV